ncbi:hypothetical protein [Tenacibaculum discolor]|uniref:hypothetical protein n=1 Tax=Tenacibaculum discolor TaxID=361581 RepID=UPI00159B9F67|nr:hypothetical protein [Tenacibaculum discolor]
MTKIEQKKKNINEESKKKKEKHRTRETIEKELTKDNSQKLEIEYWTRTSSI